MQRNSWACVHVICARADSKEGITCEKENAASDSLAEAPSCAIEKPYVRDRIITKRPFRMARCRTQTHIHLIANRHSFVAKVPCNFFEGLSCPFPADTSTTSVEAHVNGVVKTTTYICMSHISLLNTSWVVAYTVTVATYAHEEPNGRKPAGVEENALTFCGAVV